METASADHGALVRGPAPRPPAALAPRPAESGEGWSWPWGLAFAAVFALLGAGGQRLWQAYSAGPEAPTNPGSKSMVVAPPLVVGDGEVEVAGGGLVELSLKVPGKVAEVLVGEADQVAAGAPLLKLEDVHAELEVARARIAVQAALEQERQAGNAPDELADKRAEAEKKIEAAEQALASAKSRLATIEAAPAELWPPGYLNTMREKVAAEEKTVEAARLELKNFDHVDVAGKLALARAARRAAELQVQQAERLRDDHVLRAPAAGQVVRVNVAKGSVIGPATLQPPVLFCPAGARQVRLEVEQELAHRVAAGQAATVHSDTAEEIELAKGKVAKVSGVIGRRRGAFDPRQRADARTLSCLIELAGDDSRFKVGQRVRVRILTAAPAPAAVAPAPPPAAATK